MGHCVDLNGVVCCCFKIQSDRQDPFYLDERIEHFLENLQGRLQDVTPDVVTAIAKSMILFQLQTSRSTTSEFACWDAEIALRKYDFDRRIEESRYVAARLV